MAKKISSFERRRNRVRYSLRKKGHASIRLSVHRTSKHIYAQLIDDNSSNTLCAASSLDKDLGLKKTSSVAAAEAVGKKIATIAKELDAGKIVFDRGGYIFHGRVKALAEGARAAGLKF